MKYETKIPDIKCSAMEISCYMVVNLQIIMMAQIDFFDAVKKNRDPDYLREQAISICEKYGLPTDFLKKL